MKVRAIIKMLQNLVDHGTSPDDEVRAWDADAEEYVPVTGAVFGGDGNVDLQTDEP